MRMKREQKGVVDFFCQMSTVCKLWRAVMAMYPKYWTKITIFVDQDPTPLADIEEWLHSSQNLPITVRVGRRDSLEVDAEEGRRTRAVVDILKPHICRCTEIIFQVIHGSSLPTVSFDLQHISSILTELHLECQHDDGAPAIEAPTHDHGELRGITSRPKPNAITLHGHTILDVLKYDSEMFNENFGNIKFKLFDASNYHEEDIIFSLFVFLSAQLAFDSED